ncbi:MurR/RpiR family transcriptional regulator [Treponema sp.]
MEDVLFLIRMKLDTLAESERKIADLVLTESRRVIYYNIGELASRSSSSQAAVTRFCKKLGLTGFQELKLRLAGDAFGGGGAEHVPSLDLDSINEPATVTSRIIARTRQSLSDLEHIVEPQSLKKVADTIGSANYVHLFGIGASGVVAYDFYQKLQRVGVRCGFALENHVQIIAACSLRKNDVGFFVSYSGETDDIVRAAREAKSNGALIVTLTKLGEVPLSAEADIALRVPVSESAMRQGAITSRIDQLAVVDILFSLIIARNLDATIESMERTLRAARGDGRDGRKSYQDQDTSSN